MDFDRFDALPWPVKIASFAMVGTTAFMLFLIISMWSGIKIDTGLATLVGAVVGLGVVAWQTNRGFRNLVRSQDNQARLDRDARLHQSELDRDAQTLQRITERQTLLSALRAEIVYLYGAVTNYSGQLKSLLKVQIALKAERVPSTTKSVGLVTFDAPIFRAHISLIGLVGTYLGADIVKVLSRANGKELKFTLDTAIPHDVLITLHQSQIVNLDKWASDLYHVAMRIRAYEEQTEDPGTLVATEKDRHPPIEEHCQKVVRDLYRHP